MVELIETESNFPYLPTEYYSFDAKTWRKSTTPIIVETTVSLTVNGDLWLSFMCTPIDLEAMAVGFLFNEEIITAIDEIASIRLCPAGDNVDVWLHHQVQQPDLWRRTSGCTGGVTSIDSTYSTRTNTVPQSWDTASLFPVQNITQLTEKLLESQNLYKKTGGVHTSVLTDGDSIQVVGEDIGRHNTLDKIAGKILIHHIEMSQKILLTTGRISSEMIQKASRIGTSIVISRTSPSSLSIEEAKRMGITLIGYARRDRFRVYTYPEKILGFQ
jgi:FdhD protein